MGLGKGDGLDAEVMVLGVPHDPVAAVFESEPVETLHDQLEIVRLLAFEFLQLRVHDHGLTGRCVSTQVLTCLLLDAVDDLPDTDGGLVFIVLVMGASFRHDTAPLREGMGTGR